MEQFTVEELQNIIRLCESRVRLDNLFKAEIPAINIMGDLASTSALSEKVNRAIGERMEKEREEAAKAKKEVKEG